jgi:ribonuclease HI
MAYGGLEHSTNNYMELVAIKEALDTNTGNVTLLCDSQYAIAVCTRTCRPAPDHVDIKFEIINLMQGREVIFEKIESKKNEAHPLVVAGRQKAAKR